jgi:adhesin transport system outer membrane protein
MATSWNSMANLRAQLPYLRDHAVATAKVREAYRQQFQIGQRTLLDLLDTENERFQAARALANAEYDLQLAQYRWLSLAHRLLPTLLLAQLDTSKQLPDEAAELELTEEVIKLCSSVVPDTSALKPIAITYGVDDKPPTITPSKAAPRRPAANKSSQSPQSPRPAKW